MLHHNIEQNTDEWLALRAGKLTGSGFSKIMANYGKAFGEPAKKYAADIALEKITGAAIGQGYSNDHMERGHEQEPIARMKYEEEFFCEVDNGGFFESDWIGVSPDGLVLNDGVIEIKSVISSAHYNNIKRQSFDPAYRWQLVGNLKFTGREWIDFISFCADYPDDKKLYTFRLFKDDLSEEFNQMDDRIEQFKKLIETTKNNILDSKYYLTSTEAA